MYSIQDLKKMAEKDLQIELEKTRINSGKLKFLIKAGQEKAVHNLKNLKKYLARILTTIKEVKLTINEN